MTAARTGGHRFGDDRSVLVSAIHMLHEQAHGQVPFRTCHEEPCRSLNNGETRAQGYIPTLRLEGPAPGVLPPLGTAAY